MAASIEVVIGLRMHETRRAKELTQEQFGQSLGELLGRAWSRQAVSSAEQGGRQFTAAELVAIAHVLNTTVPALMTPSNRVEIQATFAGHTWPIGWTDVTPGVHSNQVAALLRSIADEVEAQ